MSHLSSSHDLESGAGPELPTSPQSLPHIPTPIRFRRSSSSPVSTSSSPVSACLPMVNPSTLQIQTHQRHVTSSYESLGMQLMGVQVCTIIGLVPVCLVENLPAEWLCLPLLAVMCLLGVAFLLTHSYWLAFPPYMRISEVSLNNILTISVLLTTVAVLITIGSCIAHLVLL